jgi:carbamoyl-phosphate synthase large subunit
MPPLSELDPKVLAEFCSDHGIGLILPTRDGELMYFAENREFLAAAGVHVNVCSPDSVDQCLDKLIFFERCRDGGLPAIPTFPTLEALLEAMPGENRIVVKERRGAGSRTLGLGLDPEAARSHAVHLEEPVFQPEMGGVEHSVDLYVNLQEDVVEVVPRVRLQVRAGESVITETVEAPELVLRSIDLASLLGLRGHNVLQAFVSPAGEPVFIECNPRVGGASALSMEAGLDSLRWGLMEASGLTVGPRLGRYRRGLRMVRYPCDRFVPL